MSFWGVVKNLKYKQIYYLFVKFLRHPLCMFATVKATFITLKIVQKQFPNVHNGHNKANAFRHGLWNLLIAKECLKFTNSVKIALLWTKQITDWHEVFSKNTEMPRLMDYHNNAHGRKKFLEWRHKSNNTMVMLLHKELLNAVLVNKKHEFVSFSEQFVYLEK